MAFAVKARREAEVLIKRLRPLVDGFDFHGKNPQFFGESWCGAASQAKSGADAFALHGLIDRAVSQQYNSL